MIAAEVGYLDLAYDYLVETVFTDLDDLHGNVSSGLHIAAPWRARGLTASPDSVACVVPAATSLSRHGSEQTDLPVVPHGDPVRPRWRVAINSDKVTYRLLTGEPIELAHHGHSFLLAQCPVTLPVPKDRESNAARSTQGP